MRTPQYWAGGDVAGKLKSLLKRFAAVCKRGTSGDRGGDDLIFIVVAEKRARQFDAAKWA